MILGNTIKVYSEYEFNNSDRKNNGFGSSGR